MKYLMCLSLAFLILFPGCDYLDIIPEEDIETVETIFENREQVDEWLQTCYVLLARQEASVRTNPGYLGTDEIAMGLWGRRYDYAGINIADGLQMSQEPYGNIWHRNQYYAGIRYCNIFLEKIDGVYNMPQDEKKLWAAEIKALKAHFILN